MRCLLDTHTLIWWMTANPQLSKQAHALIEQNQNISLVSVVSAWEIATKVRLGKLPAAADLVQDFALDVEKQKMKILVITADHAIRAGSLPGPHKNPFDRMLIAQAIAENIPIISNDKALDGYGAQRLW
jgi:PIN domain nuclease of toxin-antitoxin system